MSTAMTREDLQRMVLDEIRDHTDRQGVSQLANVVGDLRVAFGYCTDVWPDLQTMERKELNAALERAGTEAMIRFVQAYVTELHAFVMGHPDMRRPLPRYLRDVELEEVGAE
jgi:hypothetical protein